LLPRDKAVTAGLTMEGIAAVGAIQPIPAVATEQRVRQKVTDQNIDMGLTLNGLDL
jgi:hypothetical protein